MKERYCEGERFADLSFVEETFEDCDFTDCVFVDCMFTKCELDHTTLNECKFVRCEITGLRSTHSSVQQPRGIPAFIRLEPVAPSRMRGPAASLACNSWTVSMMGYSKSSLPPLYRKHAKNARSIDERPGIC